ncbi:hypothetical protein [Planctopirus hydrillae]|uniref:Uncharacterized protein n=1 Tax=Planctopirus hydrillae TaxID=1841610 RepID=A0A1C3E4K7_9PLAN|nr:hypothetical protein [Planctopirus hydrillae]ODA28181.1 hypothetical protein A6X21_13490 [Planctopirus hydrillae]
MPTTEVASFPAVQGNETDQTVVIGNDKYPLGVVKDIFAADEHYILYTCPKDQLWLVCDSTLNKLGTEFNLLWTQVQQVNALPMLNAKAVKRSILASLATAVTCAIEEDFVTAKISVEQARTILQDASQRTAKSRYMLATSTTGIIFATGGMYLFSHFMEAADATSHALFRLITASITGGSIGALLSAMAPRAHGGTFEPFSTPATAFTDGMLRIIYGVITAFVVTLAVETGIVTSSLVTSDKTALSLLLVAVVGGFLERWAIDIIRNGYPTEKETP